MVKKLIINADDFGMTEGVTKGIIDCHADGVLTSTTLIVNAPYTEFALAEAKKYPALGVGIHLNITYGRPLVAGAKSFTDEDGNFWQYPDYQRQKISADPKELYAEWQAQIERFIALAGKLPTHIDSHHHVHCQPQHQTVVMQLAKEYDLPVRRSAEFPVTEYENAHFCGDFFGDEISVATITTMLQQDEPILEIMCHPAYLDQMTYHISSYNLPRMTEMAILRSPVLRTFIEQNGIELITFTDLEKIKGISINSVE